MTAPLACRECGNEEAVEGMVVCSDCFLADVCPDCLLGSECAACGDDRRFHEDRDARAEAPA